MMYFWILVFVAISTLHADERKIELWQQADAQYQRVLAGAGSVRDTSGCIQTQMEYLSVAGRDETALALYRKAFCEMAAAAGGVRQADFTAAATDFGKAYDAWEDRARPVSSKNRGPEPSPSSFRALSWISRLNAGEGQAIFAQAQNELAAALTANVCPAESMTQAQCAAIRHVGREWLGWIGFQEGDLYRAASHFERAPAPGWTAWIVGKNEFRERKFADAAGKHREAIDAWTKAEQERRSLFDRIGPKLDRADALTELGGAQYLAGDASTAIATLSAALKANPKSAKALYLRGRAKESMGQTDAAILDYNLASRTAFAEDSEDSAAEAHLYLGVMLYLRKQYARAESEFTSALTFELPEALRQDLQAWQRMAAVSAGSCADLRQALERALESASPYFPKAEARSVASSCLVSATSGSGAPGSK